MIAMPTWGLAPGIYFGLADEPYYTDPAISRTDIVNLIDTPNSYWLNSWMNPERKAKDKTDALEYGSAFDMLLFEPQRFRKCYQIVPIDPWEDAKLKINYDDYMEILACIKVLKAGRDSTLFLSGGMPQVTIVFDFEGIRYRTRHDYFSPVMSADFKTIRSLEDRHLKHAFWEYGYDIQLALYKWSRIRFREQYAAGEAHVYGEVDPRFFERFLKAEISDFMFIFQRKTKPFPYEPLMPSYDTEENGQDRITQGIKIFTKYLAEYGAKEWPVCDGKAKEFSMFRGKETNE
jgi:hypothetical protein